MSLRLATRLVWCYVVIVVATLVTLIVLSSRGSALATPDAWGHAVVVSVFAVLPPARIRSARLGRAGALGAVGIIAGVLTVVNLVEAAVPHAFPVWMRVEMVGIAVLMGAIGATVVHERRSQQASGLVAAGRG